MRKIGIYTVKKAQMELIKKLSGGMATVSTSILVLAAGSNLPTSGLSAFYLAFTAASVPLLIASMLSCFHIVQHDEVPDKAHDFLGYLFSGGIATGFVGYILLLAMASFWTIPAFISGIAVAGYFYVKLQNVVKA